MQLDISREILLFDGKRAHCVTDFTGERYSLVFFMCPRFNVVSDEAWDVLHEAEFPVLSAKSMERFVGALRKPRGFQLTRE